MSETLTGKLLIASPLLEDPNFSRTVVFLCAHSEGGAFGLVINRPGDEEIATHLPGWLDLASSPTRFYEGGPVEPAAAFGIGRLNGGAPERGWLALEHGLGLLDLGQPVDHVATRLTDLRIFRGYAGWSPGQLEGEIASDAWFVVDAAPGDLFVRDPSTLWRDVLRRQPGKLAMYAYFPVEPGAN